MRTRPSWRAALGAVASPEHRTLICDEFIYQYQWLSRACESCSARETGGRPGRADRERERDCVVCDTCLTDPHTARPPRPRPAPRRGARELHAASHIPEQDIPLLDAQTHTEHAIFQRDSCSIYESRVTRSMRAIAGYERGEIHVAARDPPAPLGARGERSGRRRQGAAAAKRLLPRCSRWPSTAACT